MTGLTARHGLEVKLNGKPLEPSQRSPALTDQPQDVWLEFDPRLDVLEVPENLVTARVEQADGEVRIDDIELEFLYWD